jgi:hypothetical protein
MVEEACAVADRLGLQVQFQAYFRSILGLFQVYIRPVLGVFQVYLDADLR